MTRRKKILIFGGGAVVIAMLVALNAANNRERAQAVRIAEVDRRDLVATVTASGQIEPKRSVEISSDITGRIIEIPVAEGDRVRRGDLLLRIDPSQYEAGVARARALLASAEASLVQTRANRDQAQRALDRATELRAQNPNLVSDEQIEQAQTSFDVAQAVASSSEHQVAQAQAGLEEAQEQLAKTVLRAPMDGEITRMAVEVGEVAVPGTFSRATGLLMTVSDLSIIQVAVRVDETDVVRLHMNDSAEVTIDAFPDTSFTGRVTKISQSASQGAAAATAGGTTQAVDYDVEVTLDNPPPGVRPDLSATAKIVTATRDSALAIPIIALTVREHEAISTETLPQDTTKGKKETEGVFVVENGLAQFRPVKVGIAGEEYFEVLEGLAAGDSIVAGPYQTIRDMRDSTAVKATSEPPSGGGGS
jgi:HlyD family secretion protein